MAEALVGSWNFESDQNLDAFMSALGLPDNLKELAKNGKPKVDISKDGTNWLIKTAVGDKVSETKYPENEEIETTNLLGQKTKAKLCVEGATLVETQTIGAVDLRVVREVVGGKYVVTMTAKGVEGKVNFTKA